MHLNSAIDDSPQAIGNEMLGHADFAREIHSVFNLVCSVQDHQLALVHLHCRIGDEPLNSLLLCKERSVRVTLERTCHHHVECCFSLGYPSHAVCKTGWSQSILTKQMTLPATTKHVRIRNA